jgi:hypothetical protein
MNCYQIQLSISSEQYKGYYRGSIRHVVARCSDGRSVQFPAALLQRVVTMEGIRGRFTLVCDADNRCIEIKPS